VTAALDKIKLSVVRTLFHFSYCF